MNTKTHTIPKMCWSASSTDTGVPRGFDFPTKKAVSNSKSKSLHLSKIGGSASFGLVWPTGRRTGVPEITIDDERPWYPTGKYFQLGIRALSLPLKLHITKLYFSYVKLFGVILPKHFSNIWSMNDRRVKVCVVTNFSWKVHCCFWLQNQSTAQEYSKLELLCNRIILNMICYFFLKSMSSSSVWLPVERRSCKVFLASVQALGPSPMKLFRVLYHTW